MIENISLSTTDNQSFVSSPGTLGGSIAGGGPGAIFAVLNIVSGHEALFSITESNQFRELQHLSLHFRKGNDAAVKEYLAAKLPMRVHNHPSPAVL